MKNCLMDQNTWEPQNLSTHVHNFLGANGQHWEEGHMIRNFKIK